VEGEEYQSYIEMEVQQLAKYRPKENQDRMKRKALSNVLNNCKYRPDLRRLPNVEQALQGVKNDPATRTYGVEDWIEMSVCQNCRFKNI